MQEKFDHLSNVHLVVFLTQCDIGDDERHLHLGFVDDLLFASGFLEALEDQGAGDRTENEHVQKDIQYEHSIIPGVLLDCRQLVIWIRVVGS